MVPKEKSKVAGTSKVITLNAIVESKANAIESSSRGPCRSSRSYGNELNALGT